MMHATRVHRITDIPDDQLNELALALQSITHTLCTGFRWRDLLILNDATSEDGAQEYAIVRESTSRQIESLTCSWYRKPSDLATTLEALAEGTHWKPPMREENDGFGRYPIERSPFEHADTCRHCA